MAEIIKTCAENFEHGKRTFAALLTNWMDRNHWSHPVMVNLAKAACGSSWLHSSQISTLRRAGMNSPGPRQFIALERLNTAIFQYHIDKKPFGGTNSKDYREAAPIMEEGAVEPPELGWFIEVFCGYREPNCPDLMGVFLSAEKAERFSKNFARLMRRCIADADMDLIEDINKIVHSHYPAGEDKRVAKFKQVLLNSEVWDSQDLQLELGALVEFSRAFDGPATLEELIEIGS